ncbi:MAG: acyl-CoA/acyl-ACP dehydrogenase [Syntrophaceae bacterium]|nr:acyl-CoA/acyl-ACP dehydrogenase [Syntrophaceae bacterium]
MKYFPLLVNETGQMIVEAIRKFVNEEVMPIRDKIDDDKDHMLINSLLVKMSVLGVFNVKMPKEKSTRSEPSYTISAAVMEEFARGDAGIGLVASINSWAMAGAIYGRNATVIDLYQQMQKKKQPTFACFAMTEPASGCDVENLSEMHGSTIQTRAVQDGDYWVINGAKRFPSNAGISSLYCVVCQTDFHKGEEGIALIYVPENAKGLSFGKFEVKAGLQSDRNCDIFFDDVRVPLSYRASGPGEDAIILKRNVSIGRLGSAASAVGCARGAFEECLKYTGERKVGGKAIREHSIAADILADTITGIESARAYYLQVAYMLSHPQEFGDVQTPAMLSHASSVKNYACNMANTTIGRLMELMGSYGYIRDYHVEKYWRDVKEIQLWLGGHQLGQFDVVRRYYPYKTAG